jgi:hypothetical protein
MRQHKKTARNIARRQNKTEYLLGFLYLLRMEDSKKIEQGFIIDRLTNSILNTISGDSFQTEVIRLGKSDLKHITKTKGWNFNWKQKFNEIKKRSL